MDLLGNYASSDEDEHERQPSPPPPQPQLVPATESAQSGSAPNRGGIFNSLPPPKLSSSSLFSSLSRPNSSSSASSAAKKVVQFRPPMITNTYSRGLDEGDPDDDDDDGDKGEEERKRKRSSESISTTSAASFLSSIPAPKHSATLGVLPSSSGMGRRSILETSSPASNVSTGTDADANPNVVYSNNQSNDANYANYSDNGTGIDTGSNPDSTNYGGYDHSASVGGENYAYYAEYSGASTDVSNVSTAGVDAGSYEGVDYSYAQGNHVAYPNYGSGYGDYANNSQYENNWGNSTALPESSVSIENAMPVFKKRGRKDVPPEIVEVKQDELIKNRLREDQVKSTGIAFGPAYQPASTKGKPTKLHKRKHQIGSLYFDMRQKETELAERRSKGFLTKSQTQAKYGW